MNIVWIPLGRIKEEPIGGKISGGGGISSSSEVSLFGGFQLKQYFVFENGTQQPSTPVADKYSPMHAAMKFYSDKYRGSSNPPVKQINVVNAQTGSQRTYNVWYKERPRTFGGGSRKIDREVAAKWLKF